MKRLKFWCGWCGYKTWQVQNPDLPTTGRGLWWKCERCGGCFERSAAQASRGER